MKTIIIFFVAFFFFTVESIWAQRSRMDTVRIETSAQCPMCTHRIEETLTFERGVRLARLDLESGIVEIIYRNRRTDPDRLRKAISKVGHDADDVEADPEAYAKLPGCCKKPDDPMYFRHQ